eukprot:COSAG01_NODE_2083_length_8462_cov_17.020567_5_plen_152_part_00
MPPILDSLSILPHSSQKGCVYTCVRLRSHLTRLWKGSATVDASHAAGKRKTYLEDFSARGGTLITSTRCPVHRALPSRAAGAAGGCSLYGQELAEYRADATHLGVDGFRRNSTNLGVARREWLGEEDREETEAEEPPLLLGAHDNGARRGG